MNLKNQGAGELLDQQILIAVKDVVKLVKIVDLVKKKVKL